MVLFIVLFTYVNFKGVSETGTVGNIITMAKIVILLLFVAFGIAAMLNVDNWIERFTTDFLPNGFAGIITAMGLTFIAFEGYEIIAQSGEEALNPKKNVPRAIFISIGLVVVVYILVGITAIGVVEPPEGLLHYQYLAETKETAIVEVAKQTFPWGIGGIVLLISGVVSTMSALNATTYSSSRVSFAMGRDHNLPAFFAKIDPIRHTPVWAVVFSTVLMIVMGLSLPIEDVAASADIMFLLLFLQVNVAIMTLRKKMPDLERGFKVPWFPITPIIAIILNLALAIHLFTFSAIAWYFAIGWIVGGLLIYFGYFSRIEAMEKPKEILLEEALVSRDYSVLVPVADHDQARIMGNFGAKLAQVNDGDILALHIIKVPYQLTLSEGRLSLKEGRAYLETLIQQAKQREVPVHTVIRLGRKAEIALRETVFENASDLLLMGWPGSTESKGRYFGSVIDPLLDNPPCDMAVVRYRQERPIRTILVPVAGGVNSRLAVKVATQLGYSSGDEPAMVVLMHIVPTQEDTRYQIRSDQIFKECSTGFDYPKMAFLTKVGTDIAETILDEAENSEGGEPYDMVVIGATEEPLFRNLLAGNVATQVLENASMTSVMVKHQSGRLSSILRQTVLPDSSGEQK